MNGCCLPRHQGAAAERGSLYPGAKRSRRGQLVHHQQLQQQQQQLQQQPPLQRGGKDPRHGLIFYRWD
jgi:hypothetical protein